MSNSLNNSSNQETEFSRMNGILAFLKINRVFFSYLLFAHLSLFVFIYIYWVCTYQTATGNQIYLIFNIAYLIIYVFIILLSIEVFRKSSNLFKLTNIKDVKIYAQYKLISDLLISGVAVYCFVMNILIFTLPEFMIPFTDVIGNYYTTVINEFFNPFTTDFFRFFSRFSFVFFSLNMILCSVIQPQMISMLFFFVLCLIIAIMNLSSYNHLSKILNRIVKSKDGQRIVTYSFKIFHTFLILFFLMVVISFICSISSFVEEEYSFTQVNYFFSFTGLVCLYFLFTYQLVSILKQTEKLPLNPNFNTSISKKLYKLERDVRFSERAIFFDPIYVENYVKESKGLTPTIGIIMITIGGFVSFFSLWGVLHNYSDLLRGFSHNPKWFLLCFFISLVSLTILFMGIFRPRKYFLIERTSTEIIFQKGYKRDHILLNQLQEIALDYDFIKITNSTYHTNVKLQITIALLIPNHTVCITRKIKMAFIKNDQESFESQLVKVLTKTLFILGYSPSQ